MKRLVSLSVTRPRVVLAVWLLVTVAAAVLGAQLDSRLSGGGFTDPRGPALVMRQEVQRLFGEEPGQLLVVLQGGRDGRIPDVGAAESVLKGAGARTVLTPEEEAGLATSDSSTVVLVAGFPGTDTEVQNEVPELQRTLDDAQVADSVHVTGQPALDYQLNEQSKADATRAELLVFPLLAIVLLVVFGSVVAAALPLAVAGTAIAVASGVGTLVTHVTDISNLYSNIVSMIGLAVAVDYSLFVVKRFREELWRGSSPQEAVATALRTAGTSVLFSAGAVVLALAALFIPGIMAFSSIALGGIVVTVAALVTTLVVLPAGLVLLGTRVDALSLRLPRRSRRASDPQGRAGVGASGRRRGRLRSGLTSAGAVVALLLVAVPVVGISLQSPVASATVLPSDDPARVGLEIIDQDLSTQGLFPVDVLVTFPAGTSTDEALDDVAAAVTDLEDDRRVRSVSAVTSSGVPLDQLAVALDGPAPPAAVHDLWVRHDGRISTRLLVSAKDAPDSVEAHELVRTVRADLPGAFPGADVQVGGATAQGLDFDERLVGSIPLVAGVVLLLTAVMLWVAFRSWILPLVALGSNLLVVLASTGLLVVVQRLTSDDPLNSVTPVLLFAVMFGLSMDYMVIIVDRMREGYRAGASFDDAVLDGARKTRTMVNSAALIMVAVFCSFMTGQVSIVREIGIGLALAVTLDAVVVRMVVLPNLLRAIGPRAFGERGRVTRAAEE